MSTELTERTSAEVLFAGTPAEAIGAATAVANELREVVRKQRLAMPISGREHVLIEGWQTCATLAGVAAVKDAGVQELPWPPVVDLPDEPERPGAEPRRSSPAYDAWKEADTRRKAWEHHRELLGARNRGLSYGFVASWHVVRAGQQVGWGEGRCTRGERHWVTRDDYALSSMAQTRGQSRALAAPLRFIVKLAGYETTPAEEHGARDPEVLDGDAQNRIVELGGELDKARAELEAVKARAAEGVPLLDEEGVAGVAVALQQTWPNLDGHGFMRTLARRLRGHISEDVGVALRAWAWWGGDNTQATGNARTEPENAPPPEGTSAYHH